MKTLFLSIALLWAGSTFAQYTLIPDSNFEAKLISLGIDKDGPNGKVLTSSISNITRLDVSTSSITNLVGIEGFSALTNLYCYSNQLTSLDVSKNTALTNLNCGYNELTTLNVSNNTALLDLKCNNNQLTSLDVSENTDLIILNCYINQLASLDVSKNTSLTYLLCFHNELTSLDVSKNTALDDLNCSNNQLISLDVSGNTALTNLNCGWNKLTSLDVSNAKDLTDLVCGLNQITSLDVSENTNLTSLVCYNNQLTSLDVSGNTALASLSCQSNPLLKMICVKSIAAVITNSNFIKDNSASWSEACVLITTQSLIAQDVCQASNISPLSITVLGNGSFQWYSNTIASYIGGTSLGEVATDASYTPSSNKSGTLYYYCIVKGSYGSINSNISGPIMVWSPSTSTNVVSACNKYVWAGNTYSQSGTYTSRYKNAFGCDSIATLQLTINKVLDTTKLQQITICEGAGNEYDFYGQLLSKSGYYYKNFTNNLGCDSVVSLPLVVKPITFTLPSAINYNAPAQMLNTSVSGGTFSGAGMVGNAYFDPKIAGMGIRKVTYTVNDGAYCKANVTQTTIVYDTVGLVCIKKDTVKVSVSDTLLINKKLVSGINSVVNNTIKIYPNPAHNSINIDNGNFSLMDGYSIKIIDVLSNTLFASNINQQLFTINLNQWSTGIYFVQIIDKNNNITDTKKLLVE